jgi:hypothetical protein
MITDRKPRKPKQTAPKSDIFTIICKTDLHVEAVKELQFHPKRRWRFDYAIPECKIAIEVEGGAWTGGRHTRGAGFIGDIEKYNSGTLLGWRIFRVTPENLLKSETLEMLRQAISA